MSIAPSKRFTGLEGAPHFRYLLALSLPSILSCLLEPLATLVDTVYMGYLGTRHVAAMAVAASLFNSFTWVFNFLVHISTQAIGFQRGARKEGRAVNLFKMSLILALLLGLASLGVLSLGAPLLLPLAGSTPEIEVPLKKYFYLRLWGQPLFLMGLVMMGTLRAYEKTGKVFVIGAVSVFVNALSSGVFIIYLGWGIEGAALGTIFSQGLALFMGAYELNKIPHLWRRFWREKMRSSEWKSMGQNSFYFFSRSFALVIIFFSATKIASQFGTLQLAAHHITIQLWLFASFFLDGLAVTATLLGAQYMGEKSIQTLRRMIGKISLLALAVGGFFLIFYGSAGHLLWPFFSRDSSLWANIALFWPFVWASQPLNALAFIADGILFGIGDFRFLGIHMWVGGLVFYLPLALLALWQNSYGYLLGGLVALNLYRTLSGYGKLSRFRGAA